MTTAYVIQVDLPKGTAYIGRSGRFQPAPKFFISVGAVRLYLRQKPTYRGIKDFYCESEHSQYTKVITIRELENGLKESKAEVDFYTAFMQKTAPAHERLRNNPNAIYKLRTADGQWVSFGQPKPKHGKIWNRAGDLRSHITTHLGYQARLLQTKYKGAEVIEIIMGADGIMPSEVNTIPIVSFYTASPSSAARYQEATQVPHHIYGTADAVEFA